MSPSVLLVFLDGVGLGPAGADNPLSTLHLPAFERLAGGRRWTAEAAPLREPRHVFAPIDATLGVEGLPQSGTGQAALFTGENAARLHGRHYGPTPPTTVRPTVAERSVFARLVGGGVAPDRLAFANAYPERFFSAVESSGRWTATTLAASAAGVRLRREADVARGEALPADLTGETWARLIDPGHAPTTEAEAARRLGRIAADHRFTLSEYFLTDKAGHSREPSRAEAVLRSLDRFFGALLDMLDDDVLLLVTSDHGNLEDLGTKSHTRHPVPLVAWGPEADAFADARSLLDVTPRIVQLVAGET